MTKSYFVFMLLVFCCNQKSVGQLIGGECFLQGTYLEIGINNNGALGSCNAPPAGYHPHCPTCTPGGGGINSLAEVYDWGHDGWGTGTPAYMGDYTNPGSPFEGWAIQANGQINEAFQSNICPGAFGCCHSYLPTPPTIAGILTGSNTSYATTPGKITGNWAGTALGGAMAIKQETRVDINASWVVMTVHLYNTTALPITDVYYLRSCDPDNTITWTAGTTATTNKIVYQNDWDHRVLVSACDNALLNPAYDSNSAYLGLGTKDCRAKVTFYDYSGAGYGNLFPDGSPSDIWNQSLITTALSGATPFNYPYIVNTTSIADEGIALVFKIGTIPPNDSAVLSYAYIFNGNSGLDSAFPDPVLNINNALTILPVYPFNQRDTFDACLFSGTGTFPMDIPFATDKSWTWSKWTWMPSTGLSATTGTHVSINTNELPGVTTYTVTGVDSAANNFSCNYKTFIFSIKPCHGASSNSPCYGDLVYFGRGGDSLGATYVWLGPGGFTSTLHHPIIYPALYTDSGMYYVIRTIGGVHDTDSTRVVIHEKPVITVTYNAPMCANKPDTLKLSVTPLLPGEVFSWTGPNAFTSAMQFPTVNDFSSTDIGSYTVIATTPFGCRDTASIYATLVSPPDTPTISGTTLYCQGDLFTGFTAIPNPATAGTVRWYTSASGGIPTGSPASIYNTAIPGSQTIYASVINSLGCESQRVSLEMTVIYKPVFSILPGNTFVCQFDSMSFAYNGPPLFQPEYTWSLPPNAIYAHTADHALSGPGDSVIIVRFDSVTANTYIHLHVSDNNGFCSGDTSYTIKIVAPPVCTAYTPGEPCQGDTVALALSSRAVNAAKFTWSVDNTPLDQTTAMTIITHNSNSGGPFSISWSDSGHHIIQVQTSSIEGCTSLPAYDSVDVHARPDASFTYLTKNGMLCLEDSVLFTARNTDYGNSYTWTPEHFFNNTNQPEIYGKVELSRSTVTLLVTTPYHCTATTSQDIFPGSCCTVKFPTAFTPNGDGKDDYFRPIFEGYHRFSQFRIANRWGQIVFESANSNVKWDGSYNGVPQDIGVYFYYIKFDCGGKTMAQAGDVTLIR